ncbi:DUF29 domain-containing protein [Leptolyngbya sp. BC1307]|uniref:DUF29 domain-containing protein n=1 Tax=Leptolyngbya sp. BC1307 TaxID=2029589 RepID=UPI000EFB06E6|nr:DUF29 domain-containing protein [Leptolyngbya sp. BC1307]
MKKSSLYETDFYAWTQEQAELIALGRWSNSWRGTIREQRKQINLLLKDSPSLKPYLQEALPDAYELGTALAMKETQLAEETFSENCPYLLADILETNFFPTARPE